MATDLEMAFGANLISEEITGKIDIEYLLDIPNRSSAQRALDFIDNQTNEIELHKRHPPHEMQRMWRGVLRGCIAHGVPLTQNQSTYAKMLGIVLPG